VIGGNSYDDALNAAKVYERASGALPIHAFDQLETLLGQGTLALEFQQQAPDLNSVLVSVGGGGLIGGIAAWFKSAVSVVGVEPERSPTMTLALKTGAPVDAPAGGIAADSLAPRRIGDVVFPIASTYVDEVILVSDEDIRAAQRILGGRLRIVAEPGGVAALSAVLSGKYKADSGNHIGVVISGGNTVAVNFQNPESEAND
jgi:threonine dehydratase